MRLKSYTSLSAALALFSSIAGGLMVTPTADAQVLRDLTGRVEDRLGDTIADQVDDRLDDRLRDVEELRLPENLDELVEIDRLENLLESDRFQILSSSFIGNTLEDTINRLGGAVAGVRQAAQTRRAFARSIDIERYDDLPAMRDEWVVMVSADQAAALEALDLTVLERNDLSAAQTSLFVLRFPSENAGRVRSDLAQLGADILERNYVYRAAGQGDVVNEVGEQASHMPVTDAPSARFRLGMIDTDVEEGHEALAGLSLREADFVSHGDLRPTGHGTAVASILSSVSGAGDDRSLLAASAFFLSSDGQTGATTSSLIQSIDWLVSEGADVINVSLTGPPDASLERFIAQMQARGVVFVAAVGNGGPAAAPLYPAAYDGVVGVTAVDEAGQVYRWANRGAYVDIAALGVNVTVAAPDGGTRRDSGTSFASPLVAAFLAGWADGQLSEGDVSARLASAVSWTPEQGRDAGFGIGILTLSPDRD